MTKQEEKAIIRELYAKKERRAAIVNDQIMAQARAEVLKAEAEEVAILREAMRPIMEELREARKEYKQMQHIASMARAKNARAQKEVKSDALRAHYAETMATAEKAEAEAYARREEAYKDYCLCFDPVTEGNLQAVAERAAYKTANLLYTQSGDPHMLRIVKQFSFTPKGADAEDLISVATIELWKHRAAWYAYPKACKAVRAYCHSMGRIHGRYITESYADILEAGADTVGAEVAAIEGAGDRDIQCLIDCIDTEGALSAILSALSPTQARIVELLAGGYKTAEAVQILNAEGGNYTFEAINQAIYRIRRKMRGMLAR